ncbi:MAG TPA: dTDP-4-dehydrorhamnose reductase [Vicinamibacterales bacterium]
MTPSRVLVTGANGQLAHHIIQAFSDRSVTGLDRSQLDVTDPDAVRRVVADLAPDLIVNCTAFNDVDGAEDRPNAAMAVNAFAVRSLALAAQQLGATLVHYSTDFVFDGTGSTPYGENDEPAPQSTYAASKLLGEWFALEAPHALVLRVESLFGSPSGWAGRRGTVDNIVFGLRAGREVPVLVDRIVSPSYSPDVAAATRHLIEGDAASGIYHCVNAGHATWEAVAIEVARQLGVEPRLKRLKMDELKLKAARPRYCALATAKVAAEGFVMPPWQDAVARWLLSQSAAQA